MKDLRTPVPHHGDRRRWTKQVWDRLGNPDIYLEPCGGSLEILLGRPHPRPGLEVVCDTSGLVSNFWRAMRDDHEALAREADYPTIHQDLTARQKWLMEWSRENRGRLSEDPDYHDVRAAGWWAWGASNWLGPGWCITGEEQRPRVGTEGRSQGIQAQRAGLEGEIGTGERLLPWFQALARRLSRVVVLNQDWKAAVAPNLLQENRNSSQVVGIFLDPRRRTEDQHGRDPEDTSDETARETWVWARFTGERYRIGYACREGSVEPPRSWETLEMESDGIKDPGRREAREMLIFSPACILPQPSLFGPDF